MSIYDRPYPESRRERERGYREPHFGRRGNGQRDDDDDRGSWMSRDRDYFERGDFRDYRGRDPFEPREGFRGQESDRDSYQRDFGRERKRFEPFEDWESPRELSPQRSFRRGSRAAYGYGYGGGSYGRYAGRGPKGYQRSDERLRDEVCDRLTADPDIDASEITVTVQDCEVTFEGTIPNRSMKRGAEECAEEVSGVRQVHNRLRIETNEGRDEDRSARYRSAH